MIQSPLFISYTDFSIGNSIHFPYKDVVNYIVQVPNTSAVIQLTSIVVEQVPGLAEYSVCFNFSDNVGNSTCYTKYSGKRHEDNYIIEIISATHDAYCGCLEVSEGFYMWMTSLPLGTIEVENDSVILNPGKYFYYTDKDNKTSADLRFNYQGLPVDKIEFPGFTVNSIGELKDINNKEEDTQLSYLEYFVLHDKNKQYQVYGPNIAIMLSDSNPNKDTRIMVEPGVINITDFYGR